MKKMKGVLFGLLLFGAVTLSSGATDVPEPPSVKSAVEITVRSVETNGVTVRWFEEMVPMRDGTKLYTYGALPPAGEKAAIVIMRSPYVGERPVDMTAYALGETGHLKRGYAYVHQHVRGCGMSDGAHRVYVDERNDGLDTLAWIRTLPHYSGSVFLQGASYLSSVHWSYLDTNPSDVKGCYLTVQDANRYNIHYRNGNFKIALHGNWSVNEHKKKDKTLRRNPAATFTDLPLKGFTERRLGEYVPEIEASWDHPDPSDLWWQLPGAAGGEYRHALFHSRMPVMMVTGFYDIYTEGVFDMWREISPSRRANCALVVDDGHHGGRRSDIDSALDWFDWCQGRGKLKCAIPGETVWFGKWEKAWRHAPLMTDGAEAMTWKLDFKPGAFTYDPKNPPHFNVVGCHTFGGIQTQPATGWCKDVITCELPPLEKSIDIQGRMRLALKVKSDCEDTAFYVRLSVRKLDGKWYNLRDDIKTILCNHDTYRPGDVVEIKYDLSDHAFLLKKDERLRLEVAGASADQFVPHTNQRGPFHLQAKSRIAHNEVLGGTLTVPVGDSIGCKR